MGPETLNEYAGPEYKAPYKERRAAKKAAKEQAKRERNLSRAGARLQWRNT